MRTEIKDFLDPGLVRKLEQLELVVRRLLAGRMRGERRSKRRGAGSEFADYREYVQGDDLRFIDWNVFGRLDRLFLKLFHEEEDLQLAIFVDASKSMSFGDPQKFRYGCQLAAGLAYVGMANFDRVSLEVAVGGKTEVFPTRRGKQHFWRLVEFLSSIEPSGEMNLHESLRGFAYRHPSPGIKVVISDFLDKRGFIAPLKWLVRGSSTGAVVQLLSPQEVKPTFVGDLALEDCEDGALTEVSITGSLLKRYQSNLQGLCGGLREACRTRGIAYFYSQTKTPLELVLLKAMREQGVLR